MAPWPGESVATSCSSRRMRPAVKSISWPPNIMSSSTPATKSTAEPRSWLNATWPCSRASCRRWAVGSNDFSPADSAMARARELGAGAWQSGLRQISGGEILGGGGGRRWMVLGMSRRRRRARPSSWPSVSNELRPKPTAMTLICGTVRLTRPRTSVESSSDTSSGAAARMPRTKLCVMMSVSASTKVSPSIAWPGGAQVKVSSRAWVRMRCPPTQTKTARVRK